MAEPLYSLLFLIVDLALSSPSAGALQHPSKSSRANAHAETKESVDRRWSVQPAVARVPSRPTLSAPTDLRFIEIDAAPKVTTKLVSELALQWSPVIGARSYAVQFCDTRRFITPIRKSPLRGFFGEEELFRDLAIVSGTRYIATGLFPRKEYWFRVVGIDAQGRRGDDSGVLIGSAP